MYTTLTMMAGMGLGEFIDVLDSAGNWCVGQVTDLDHAAKKVQIHFESWGARYDEGIEFKSNRLALFRRKAKGYTGQKKEALRPGFTYNKVEIKLVRSYPE